MVKKCRRGMPTKSTSFLINSTNVIGRLNPSTCLLDDQLTTQFLSHSGKFSKTISTYKSGFFGLILITSPGA